MRTLAIANQKGGSAKTTTSVNLAATLAEKARRVLLIDLDAQANATQWLRAETGGRGLLDVFSGAAQLIDIVFPSSAPGVDMVGASSWLVGAEKALAGEVGAETLLRRELADLPAERWDYILIDCPPALGILTVNALTAAKELLIPVETHTLALNGLAQLMQTVELVRDRLNADLRVAGIVPCRVASRTRHSQEVIEALHAKFGNVCTNVSIRENVRIAECPSFGIPITLYASNSAGAEDYRALALEIIAQEGSF